MYIQTKKLLKYEFILGKAKNRFGSCVLYYQAREKGLVEGLYCIPTGRTPFYILLTFKIDKVYFCAIKGSIIKVIALKFCNNWSEYRRVFFLVSLRENRPGNMLFKPENTIGSDVTRRTWCCGYQ